jgi:hypothetical protein
MIDAAVEESVAQNQVLTEAVPHQFEGPLTIPLAHYSTEVSNYAPQRGTMIGTPAIFAGKFGAGRVVAISPHPESTKGDEFLVKLAVLATGRTRAKE